MGSYEKMPVRTERRRTVRLEISQTVRLIRERGEDGPR